MAFTANDPHSLQRALNLILEERSALLYDQLRARRCRMSPREAVVFLKDVFVLLSQREAYDPMLAAALTAPQDALFGLVPLYYAACILLKRRQFADGFALLAAFRNRCLEKLADLPTEDTDGFLVLLRHAVLLTDESYLETPYYREQLQANQALLDTLHWEPPPEGADDAQPVLVVACDHRYARLFLERFLASADTLCRDRLIHLHLVDPPDTAHPLDGLPRPAGNRLAASWERSGKLKSSAYYASARFVRAGELLERYRRPIQIFDVDVALRHPPEMLDQAMRNADFGCFRTGMLNPCSEYLAEVTAFMPTPAGLALADMLRRLILSKMSIKQELLWLIDQAVLYSAIYVLAEKAGRLRVADFTRETGMRNEQYIQQCDGTVDKLALMKAAGDAAARDAGA